MAKMGRTDCSASLSDAPENFTMVLSFIKRFY
jgi:hypothetical protein